MAYTAPTVSTLANFTGRAESTYTPYASQALLQAALLFTLVSGISEVPDDADKAQLIDFAIMEMADEIYVKQLYFSSRGNPYMTSETIGSYSYSRSSSPAKALSGEKTGLLWWDLAIKQLGQAVTIESGSIAVFERDGNIWADAEGNQVLVGPAEVAMRGFTYNDIGLGYPGDSYPYPD